MERNQSNGKKAKTPKASVKRQSRRTADASIAASPDHPAFSPEERHQLISEAAYYRAQQRGFSGGDPIKDWLEAEVEVSGKLRAVGPQDEGAELP